MIIIFPPPDINLSVYTVTSKSLTVQWSSFAGASSYKITATPKNSPEPSTFAQFSGNLVMGSVNSLSPNTIYIVGVEAMDNTYNVLSSAEIEEITAPEVPTIEQAYSKQSDSITVEFSAVPGASSYILRAESKTGDFFSETPVSASPGTVLHLRPYTDYTLSVMSVNSGGRSQPSLPVEVKTVVAAPELNSTSPSNSTIFLTWDQVEHAVLYTLCIIMEGSDTRVKLNTTETSVAFNDLEPGTTYCIKGNAWDPQSIPGDDFTVCQITRPPTPSSIQVMFSTDSSHDMTVHWDTVRGADRYLALSSTGQNCTSSDSHCVITPLSCGQNHSVSVTAMNQAGPCAPSEPEAFLTYPCPPEPIWVEEPVPGNCTVLWREVPWADYYKAFVKRDDGSEELCNTTGNTCNYHCDCGYTYFMTVFAYNRAGSSPPGRVLNYTTIPCCPEDVSISLVSTETLEIMWSPVRGAEVYETKAAGSSDLIHCNDTAPVCALSDLNCNTKYSVVVRPCSELRGCNNTCRPHTEETAPCSPEILGITQTNASAVLISWRASNREANYTVSVVGERDSHTCQSTGTSCEVPHLPCGSIYEVSAVASTSVGLSLPSYVVPLETGPCCPQNLTVTQVTQAMTNVTWSAATGAQSYITSLTSPRGHAKCHTLDTHCLMGCITCGTNYTVSLEAISSTGHKSECTYHGFSSSACCPLSVKLYWMTNNTIRVYWRSSGGLNNYTADLYGANSNYTCTPLPGSNSCDVSDIVCGDVYTVVVAPLSQDGTKIKFCPKRMYSVSCSGSNVGMVIYRGKRSVD
ncbi:fibronectin type III domain-containing protein 7-like [Megalops cyprinoides]|uniref:fibronectin type III domain-containing protein 7-like n=1 Tax=Megalops cyprinoides TaxID=118141 RepID=UPI0018644274|nr:fibronectin type III domain-containing protein 7-like [Megalops cyprinoides]